MRIKKFYGMVFAALLICGSFQVMGEAANKDAFKTEVLEAKMPVVVLFLAKWCGPCEKGRKVVDELEKDYSGKVKFREVNTDEDGSAQITQKYGVSNLPTFMLFKDGRPLEMPVDKGVTLTEKEAVFLVGSGAQTKEKLKKWIESVLKK